MANVANANTIYIDTTGDVTYSGADSNIKVSYITLTTTAGTSQAILQDQGSTNPIKIDLRAAGIDDTKRYNFSNNPLVFPTGIRVGTLTGCVLTLVITRST